MQRWPETKRLLGLLVNSSGAAHARNARRLVHATRKEDRRLSAALLRLLLDPALAARLGAAGRQTVIKRFSQAAMVRETLRVYETVRAHRRAAP